MAVSNKCTRLHRRWFLTLSLVAVIGVIGIGSMLWQAVELSSLSAVSEWVERLKPILSGLRLALIGLLAIVWPRLPALWLPRDDDDTRARACWMVLRWRVISWLLVIELVLGQNVIGYFLTVATGLVA